MPLYEYECENGHRFEKILKFSDPPLEACPTCGGTVRKLISSPAFQFKGTGFYITDYVKKDAAAAGTMGENEKSDRAEAAKETKPAEGGVASKSESKSDAKSDAKTETKSETKIAAKTETKSPTPKT